MKVEFCKFLGKKTGNKITLTPLGKVRNTVKKPMLAGWEKVTTEIIIDKRYAKGLVLSNSDRECREICC